MPEHDEAGLSFEELWERATSEPVQRIESDGDAEALLSGEQLVAWLRRIGDECRADALISEEQHAELQACSDTFERILGAVPPDALRGKLKTLSDTEA